MNTTLLVGKRILVVEDNTINQMLVKHILSRTGAIIDIAPHGNKALEFLAVSTYDLILMDLYMPELDGYQTTRIIRKELQLTVPIVAMTALVVKGEDNRCILLGMDGYLPKPFTFESLYLEIERVLLSKKQEEPSETNPVLTSTETVYISV